MQQLLSHMFETNLLANFILDDTIQSDYNFSNYAIADVMFGTKEYLIMYIKFVNNFFFRCPHNHVKRKI